MTITNPVLKGFNPDPAFARLVATIEEDCRGL